jgi:hypothetical protein
MTENEMTGLLFKLADLGITGIKVHYDGGGDSGSIERIAYTKIKCDTPEDVNDNVDVWEYDANLAELDSSAYSKIKEFAHETILDDIENWYDNEGGFGDLCICVPSGKYIVYNHMRIIETEEYTHEDSLLNKVQEQWRIL